MYFFRKADSRLIKNAGTGIGCGLQMEIGDIAESNQDNHASRNDNSLFHSVSPESI
jgi:hypothetical protein